MAAFIGEQTVESDQEDTMRLNAFFPTRDIGTDPAIIRDWAQAAEDLGYAYIEVPDHVFGATARSGWTPRYNEKDPFHETFVTLGFLAAVTTRIRLSSGVLIAPQAEQVEVLRRLWSEDLVSFRGRFHNLNEVSIVPPPVQRPIPIWFGGLSNAAVTRTARLGDGWMPIIEPDVRAEEKLGVLREQLRSFGRDPAKFGIEGWLRVHDADPQHWAAAADGWRRLGADMVMLYPMYRIPRFDDQIETLRRFKDVASG